MTRAEKYWGKYATWMLGVEASEHDIEAAMLDAENRAKRMMGHNDVLRSVVCPDEFCNGPRGFVRVIPIKL